MGSIILVYVLIGFIGFAIGRIGDKYGGHLNAPHHWIYGLLGMVLGLYFHNYFLGSALMYFGAGHFLSDLNDFLELRFYGKDKKHRWYFWSVM